MRPENMVRASVEGATYALRFGVERLAELGLPGVEVVLTGGGSKSPTWRQVVADICGVEVRVPVEPEAAALGAALQALALLSPTKDVVGLADEYVRFDDTLTRRPEPKRLALYHQGYDAYRRAMEAVGTLYRHAPEAAR